MSNRKNPKENKRSTPSSLRNTLLCNSQPSRTSPHAFAFTQLTMIGVRRFLSGGTRSQSPTTASPTTPEPVPGLPPTAPLVVSTGSKSTWPPSPLLRSSTGSTSRVDNESTSTLGGASGSHSNGFHAANGSRSSSFESDSRPTSAASSVASSSRKPIPPLPSSSASPPRLNGAIPGPSSPSRPLPNRVAQLSQKLSDRNWKRSSSMVDTRDELLMSLLASEAVVDSREFEILSSEEVEELKKVRFSNKLVYHRLSGGIRRAKSMKSAWLR